MNKKIVLTLGLLIGQLFGRQCPNEMQTIQARYGQLSNPGLGFMLMGGGGGRIDATVACSTYQQSCWPTLKQNLNNLLNATSPDTALAALNNLCLFFNINSNDPNVIDNLTTSLTNELAPVASVCVGQHSIQDDLENIPNVTTGDQPLIIFPMMLLGAGETATAQINSNNLKTRLHNILGR